MKKKRRYERRKGSKSRAFDSHHLCWYKREWSKDNVARLRRFPYCIIRIPKDTLHKYIHKNIEYIPVPSDMSAEYALNQLVLLEQKGGISCKDNIEKRLMVLATLFDCSDQPTADALRKQLSIVHEFNNKPPL